MYGACAKLSIWLCEALRYIRHRTEMVQNNWDAALVIRANELLDEVRRYHVDAEATRLQLASAAASIARKVDDLPTAVRHMVEESLQQDALNAERPMIARRLDLSTRMLSDLSSELHTAGLLFLRHIRLSSVVTLVASAFIIVSSFWWAVVKASEAARLSSEILVMQKTVAELRQAGGQLVVRPCIDSFARSRLCVHIDENAGKLNDSYYFIGGEIWQPNVKAK